MIQTDQNKEKMQDATVWIKKFKNKWHFTTNKICFDQTFSLSRRNSN